MTSTVEWVPAAERMPEEGRPCLVLRNGQRLMFGLVCRRENQWVYYDPFDHRPIGQDLSHWGDWYDLVPKAEGN